MKLAYALIPALLAGCSDVITYSKDARRQGEQYTAQGQYPQALASYRSAVRQNARDYQSFYLLGSTYEKTDQFREAIAAYQTSLAVQPLTDDGRADVVGRRQTLDALAAVLATHDPRDVEINQLEARAAGSSTGEEYYLLAKTYAARGDADSAITTWQKAVLQAPRNQTIAREAGLYMEQVGQKQQAETVLRAAYRLDPSDPQVTGALRRLGVVPGPSLMEESQLAKPALPLGTLQTPGEKDPEPVRQLPPRPAPTPPPTPSPAD